MRNYGFENQASAGLQKFYRADVTSAGLKIAKVPDNAAHRSAHEHAKHSAGHD